jgi:outer membrane autotransporter protein
MALCAAPVMAASPCVGANDLRTEPKLDLDTHQVVGTETLSDNHQCDVWGVSNGYTLNIGSGGTLGNLRMDGGNLVIGNGGTMLGFAEAGGSYSAKNQASALQTWGTRGNITVQGGGTLSAALIGPQSTLTVGGPSGSAPPATLGRLMTSGTVNIENAVVDISKFSYPDDPMTSVITMNGGSVTMANSVLHGTTDLNGIFYTVGPDSQANPDPYRVAITDSTIDNVFNGIVAIQQQYPLYPPAERPFFLDLVDTTIKADATKAGSAIEMTQANNLQPITATVVGGKLIGGSGLTVQAKTDNVRLAVGGTQIYAPVAGDGVTSHQGIGAYISGPAQLLFTSRPAPLHSGVAVNTSIIGALEGIRVDSSTATSGPAITLTGGTAVQGLNGAAIHVTRQNGDPAAWSTIIVADGSTLAGLNNNLVQVDNGALSQLYTDGVALNGNITATGAGTTLLFGQSGDAHLNGTLSAASGADIQTVLNGATFTGNASADGTGTFLGAEITGNSTMSGNVTGTNGAGIAVAVKGSHALLDGGVIANTGAADVAVADGGRITGGVQLLGDAIGTIAVDGAGSSLSRSDGPAVAVSGGGNADIDITNGGQLASATGSLLSVTGGSQANVRIANSTLSGNLDHDAASTLNVSLTDNADFTGNMAPGSLAIANGAVWRLGDAAQPGVGALTMNNGSIDFNSASGPFRTLTAASLAGNNGIFTMGVDFHPGEGNDLLAVTGNVTGTHVLDPYDDDQSVVNPRDHVTVATAGGGTGNFGLLGDRVDAGIYTYKLVRQGNSWVLVRQGDDSDNGDGTDGSGEGGTPNPEDLSPAAKTALSTAAATPFIWYNELSTLRLRQGDLRDNRAGDGLWARTFSSSNDIAKFAAPGFGLDQYGIQMGADKRVMLKNSDMYVGAFGSYSYSEADIEGGSRSRINSYSLGAYATWLLPDGWYVDTVVKANSFDTDMRVVGSDGRRTNGHTTTPGLGASVEVGKQIALPKNGFLEPYAQVAAFGARAYNDSLDSGFDMDTGATRSLQGQLGMLAGNKFQWGSHGFVQPYMKVAAITEFVSDNAVTLNHHDFTNDMSGTRMLVGAGVAAQLKQNLQIHADVDYSSGGPVDRSVRWNLGVRYAW